MEERRPLSKATLTRYAQLREGLGAAAKNKLDALLDAYPDDQADRIPLNRALAALYPNLASLKDPLKSFAQDRNRINDDWGEAGVPLRVEIDQSRKADWTARACWIAGPDLETLNIDAQVRAYTEVSATPDRDTPLEMYARDPNAPIVACYHPSNEADFKEFFGKLQTSLHARKGLERLTVWHRGLVLAGKDPEQEEATHLKRAPLALIFISIEACADGNWLTRFPQASVPVLPVWQPHLNPDKHRLGPFARLKSVPGWPSDKSARERLIADLETAIVQALNNPEALVSLTEFEALEWARHASRDTCLSPEASFALRSKIGAPPNHEASEGLVAREEIMAWLKDPQAPALLALLGEYGMGKTTLCKWIARELLEKPELGYLPLYLDLRHLEPEHAGEPIEKVLQRLLDTDGPTGHGLRAEQILPFAQQRPCLFIFDGLDEIGGRLARPAQAVSLVREFWRVLQLDARVRHKVASSRLLISARNHFFRDVQNEIATLGAEERGRTRAESYLTLLLLPFTEPQVEHFLEVRVGKERLPAVLELIRTTHNLSELSSRPLLLDWISGYLANLDRQSLGDRLHGAASLYSWLIGQSLSRDEVKSQATPEEKQAVLRALAVKMHREGSRWLEVDPLEDWFIDTASGLSAKLRVRTQSGALDALLVDLRNASLLVREGENRFRFAHTSLLEFFIADHLVRALKTGAAEEWALPAVSAETLDFVGQLLAEADAAGRDAALTTLRKLRDTYRPKASERALDYALHAHGRPYPAVSLAGVQLPGADLSGRQFVGVDRPGQALNLRGANLRGARLREALFQHADLIGADFGDAELQRARFLNCRAAQAHFGNSRLAGAEFYGCDLDAARFQQAEFRYTRWLRCQLAEATGLPSGPPEGWPVACESVPVPPIQPSRDQAQPYIFDGHGGMVLSVAWSPDGRRLASGAGDSTVRVWEADSGACLATLAGHGGWVLSVAWSPDGRRLASGAEDSTVRIWEADSGACLATLAGHGGRVLSVAWSPDGQRLASGAEDSTVRIWEADSGACLATLQGHGGWVFSVAWSPDGQRLASAGSNGRLWVWDLGGGRCIRAMHLFNTGAWASLDLAAGHIDWIHGDAWRWVGWRAPDPRTGRMEPWPAEIFGPVPLWPAEAKP